MSTTENKYAAKSSAPSSDETSKSESKSSSLTFKIVAVVAILVVLGLAGANYVFAPFDEKSQSVLAQTKTNPPNNPNDPKFNDISKVGPEPTKVSIVVDEPIGQLGFIVLPQFIAVRLPALQSTLLGTTQRKVIFGLSISLFVLAIIASIVVAVVVNHQVDPEPVDTDPIHEDPPVQIVDDTTVEDSADSRGAIIGVVVGVCVLLAAYVFITCLFNVEKRVADTDTRTMIPGPIPFSKKLFLGSFPVIFVVAPVAVLVCLFFFQPRIFGIASLSFSAIAAPIGGPIVLVVFLIALFLTLLASICAYLIYRRSADTQRDECVSTRFDTILKELAGSLKPKEWLRLPAFVVFVLCTLVAFLTPFAAFANPDSALILPISLSFAAAAIILLLVFLRKRITTCYNTCRSTNNNRNNNTRLSRA